MRHGKKFNHLGRKAPHRKAMLSNMASSLIESKRVTTTIAKAKELKRYVEPLITKAKNDTTHSRRVVFSYLQNKYTVSALFDEVAGRIGDRSGGYTRIIKTGNRLGDNADMCIIELVDYNALMLEDKPAKAKTRRSRRGKGSDSAAPTAEVAAPVAEAEEAPIVEAEVIAEEAPVAEVEETPEASAEEEKKEDAADADDDKKAEDK